METQCQNLTEIQRKELLKLLQIFEELFNVTLGTWKKYPEEFELNQDKKPICSRTYPVTKVHEEMFKKEVECLVLLGVIEVAINSEWGYPYFVQPKPKSTDYIF